MPSEIVPSIGGGRNCSFTPVFLRSEGSEGPGAAGAVAITGEVVALGETGAATTGEGATIGDGGGVTGVAEGAGLVHCPMADADSENRNSRARRPARAISNLPERFTFKLKGKFK